MKILLLLLLSFNSYAAFKVEVKKNSIVKYQAQFKTEALADAWIADNEKKKNGRTSFGLPDRWSRETDGSHTETREVTNSVNETLTEYLLPKNYSVVKVDISAEVAIKEQAENDKKEEIKQVKKILKDITDAPTRRALKLLFKDKYGE